MDSQIQTAATTNELSVQIADLMRKSDNVVLGFKLDGCNYPLWSRLMKVAIGSRGKTQFITGKPPPPTQTDPSFSQWEETDLTVFSWLISNMENKLIPSFAQHHSAKAVWDSLAITYGSGTDPLQIYDLEVKANKVNQGTHTLEEYWNHLQNLWISIDQREPNPIDCCAKGIEKYQRIVANRRLFQFLVGLDVKYDGVRRDILKDHPTPSAESAFSRVRKEAARLKILQPATKSTEEHESTPGGIGTGLAVRSGRQSFNKNSHSSQFRNLSSKGREDKNREDKNHLQCSHCGMKRHTKETCFQIVGYPEWWEDNHKTAPAKGKSVVGVSKNDEPETVGTAMAAGKLGAKEPDEREAGEERNI